MTIRDDDGVQYYYHYLKDKEYQKNVGMGESASRYGCFPDVMRLLYSALDCFLSP